MKTVLRRCALAFALAAAGAAPFAAHAHRAWLLPSATVLSGNEPWVTVDAAVSNDLFYFEHMPLRLDGLVVLAPDGSAVKAENASTSRYRSTFDVKLAQQGTYRIAVINDALMASFRAGGEMKRLRGSADSLAKQIPANAENLSVLQLQGRIESFVTVGSPSTRALATTGRGLELVPVTHPNDLIAGETATFRFVLDGQPAAGLEVSVVPGGVRYRDRLGELTLATDARGEVKVTWPGPGLYWLSAAPARPAGQGGPGGPGGPGAGAAPQGAAPAGPGGTLAQPVRRASYAATFEVLPQ